MVDIDDKAARRGIEYLVTIFRFLKVQAQYIKVNAIATSALTQVLFDEFPQLAGKYEERRTSLEETAPVALRVRGIVEQVDRIVEELESLLKAPS